jgi:hypothetical protein
VPRLIFVTVLTTVQITVTGECSEPNLSSAADVQLQSFS